MTTQFVKQNNCLPSNLYGPLPQTIFLGASVQSFSASAGWNEQGSSLTVELVEDFCIGPKVWYDNGTKNQGSIADPGFVYPEPGTPVYFRIEKDNSGEGFEFAGLVQDWTQKNDANGNPAFSVSIGDPRLILDNTQIIINDYPGNTENVYNLINAYGFIETLSKGQDCLSADECPSAKKFAGTSDDNTLSLIANERGMLWKDIRAAIHSLCSNPIAPGPKCDSEYLKDNRLVYVGSPSSSYGRLANNGYDANGDLKSEYLIDLSEIPMSPDYYRISGPTISMSELISQVCSDAGCDYYIELQPTFSSGLKKIIKVRTVSRAVAPAANALDTFLYVKRSLYPQADGGIISYTRGKEVRNENTSIFIMGGKKLQPYQILSESGVQGDSSIQPFWGVNSDNALLQAEIHSSGYYRVELEFAKLNKSLSNIVGSGSDEKAWVTEYEMRAALMDYGSFKDMTFTMSGDLGGDLGAHFTSIGNKQERNNENIAAAAKGDIPAGDLVRPGKEIDNGDRSVSGNQAKDSDLIYDFVKSYAQDYYGKQFLVNSDLIPVCYKLDEESQAYRFSHDTSNQAWVLDGTSEVIGLAHNSPATDFFRDDQGLYQPILRFPLVNGLLLGSGSYGTGDPSYIGDQDYITNGTGTGVADPSVWVKASINDKWVLGSNLEPNNNSIYFNITIPAPLTSTTPYLPAFNAAEIKNNLDAAGGDGELVFNGMIEKGSFVDAIFPAAALPDSALCCVQNNLEVYGPYGVAGKPGSVSLENDDGIVPWEYGSDQIMEQAALEKVADASTDARSSERGSVTLAGFPEIPLGSELNYTASAQDFIETRIASIAPVTDGRSFVKLSKTSWNGSSGPNLTNINVSVGQGGFTTSYQFSTYTPQFGRFSKGNAERLKRIGQTRLQNMRNIRAKRLEKSSFSFDVTKQYIEDKIGRTAKAPKSAHHTLVGRITNSGRVEVNSQNIQELNVAIPTDSGYAKTAIMSWDGIIRPVSKGGDGGLPRFISYQTGECNNFKTSSTQPPTDGYVPLSVTQAFLDPLSNPNSALLTERSDSPSGGHDFEILARTEDQGISGWSVQANDEYEDDYRFMALRGPLMIQGWGYDTNSKPIPNAADSLVSITGNGEFTSTSLQDKFLDNFLQEPRSWPVAPLDLRLDRKRGVWTIAQQPRPVHVNITGCIGTGTAQASATNLAETYDADGNVVSDNMVVTWPWDISNPTGIGKVPVYYDDNDCKNYVFPINRFDAGYIVSGYPESSKTTIYDTKSIIFSGFEVIETIQDCQNSLLIKSSDSDISLLCVSGLNTCPETGDGYFKQNLQGCLAFASGLTVETYDTTNMRVDTNLIATGTEYVQDGCIFTEVEGAVGKVEKRFTTLGFAGNLSTTIDTDNDCAVIVSGFQQPLYITNSGVCGDNDELTVFSSLIIGTGLRYVDRNNITPCQVELRSNIRVSGSQYTREDSYEGTTCLWDNTGEPKIKSLFENLFFEGNLSVTGNECNVHISGFQQATAVGNSGVCGRDNEFLNAGVPDTFADILVARTGLKWSYEGQGIYGCTGVLDSILQTSGVPWFKVYSEVCSLTAGDPASNVFERIAFIGNLSHTVDGCTTIVSGFNNILASGQTWSPDYIDCNPYVASVPLGNEGIFDKIIFTGELSTTFGSNCEIIVSGFHQPNLIIETGSCGSSSVNYYNADTFIFGTGLGVEEKEVDGKCAVLINHDLTISGHEFVINPLDPCCDRVDGAETKTARWETIGFTGNISVTTGLNPCDIFVSGFQNNIPISGEKWTRYGGSGGETDYQCYWSATGNNIESCFNSIMTTGFISLTTGADCQVYISGVEQPFRFIESGTCGSETLQTFNSKGLIFGSGLKASMTSDSNCSGIIEVDIKAEGAQWTRISSPATSCGWQPTIVPTSRRFENLVFEGNLSVTGSVDNCYVHISGVQPSIKVEGLAGCPSIAAFTESDINKIRFGTGLELTAGADPCDDGPRVDVKLIADGFDRRGGGSPTAVTQRFTKISFGENIGIASNGTCEITVTGIQTNLTLSGIASCGNANYLKETISTLEIGRGLKAENTNEVRLDLWFKGNQYTDSCTIGDAVESNTVTGIEFRDIALSENASDCSLIVSGLKTVQLAGIDDSGSGCGTVVTPFDAKRLIFGTGLELVQNGCSGVVNSTLKVTGKDSTTYHAAVTNKPVTSFNFLSDASTRTPIYVDTNGCEITISGGPAKILVSGIASCGATANYYGAAKETLEFGRGLKVTNGSADAAKIETQFNIVGISDNGCGTTAAATSVTGIGFGSGLELINGTCTGVVRTNLIADGVDRRGGATTPVVKRFTKLKFLDTGYSPFSVHTDSDNCEAIISGVPVMVTSGLAACGRAAVPSQISRGIGFGTGLQLNSDAQVNTVHKVQGVDRGGGSFTTQVFETLTFGSGLSSVNKSNCEVEINIDSAPVCISGLDTCGGSAVAQSTYECIGIGTGLKLTNNGASALIESNIQAQGTDKRSGGSAAIALQQFESLNFIGGISVHEGSECELFISGIQSAEVNIIGDAACGRSAVAEFQADTFEFGTGLQVVQDSNKVLVDSVINAAGDGFPAAVFENIVFEGGISVSGDGCNVHVSGLDFVFSGINTCPKDGGGYLKESIQQITVGSGLLATNDASVGRIDLNLTASGLTYPVLEAYPCDTNAVQLDKTNFTSLNFVGNLSVEADPDNDCRLLVSGIPSIFSGIGVCMRDVVAPFDACLLAVGTGLQLSERDGKAILNSTLTIQQPADTSSCYDTIADPTPFETISISGFGASVSDCELILTHKQNIKKTAEASCFFNLDGNSTFTETPFKVLDFGEGILAEVDGCVATITAGIAGYANNGSCTESDYSVPVTDLVTAVGAGQGIFAEIDNSAGCNAITFSQPLSLCSTNLAGQSITKSASSPYPDTTCAIIDCTDGDWNAGNGPFEERRSPKAWKNIVAGPGVGITAGCSGLSDDGLSGDADGDCTTIFYSNHILNGKSCDNQDVLVIQQFDWNYDCDFELTQSTATPTSQFDGADWTQSTIIKLSETNGGVNCWAGTIVTGCVSDGGYVVSCLTASIAGTASCNGKYWLKEIPSQWTQGTDCDSLCQNPE